MNAAAVAAARAAGRARAGRGPERPPALSWLRPRGGAAVPSGPSEPPSPAPRAAAARGVGVYAARLAGPAVGVRPGLAGSGPAAPGRAPSAGAAGPGACGAGGGAGSRRRRSEAPPGRGGGKVGPPRCRVPESARGAQLPPASWLWCTRISVIKSLNLAVGGKRVPLRAGGPGLRAPRCLAPPSQGTGRCGGRAAPTHRAVPRVRPCHRGSVPLRAEQTRISCDIAAMSQQRHRSYGGAASRRSHRSRCVSVAALWGSPVLASGVYWRWRWILALVNEVCRMEAVRDTHANNTGGGSEIVSSGCFEDASA